VGQISGAGGSAEDLSLRVICANDSKKSTEVLDTLGSDDELTSVMVPNLSASKRREKASLKERAV